MGWTAQPPGPPPPGPANDVSMTNPQWSAWGQGVLDTAWMINVFSSIRDPKDPYFKILSSRIGRRIPFPLSGDDPGPWAADGGTWEGELETDLAILKAGTKVDYTRYRREYPSVRFQDYQELIVVVEYGWGECSLVGHIFGPKKCRHIERQFTFWMPVGQPYERKNVRAYHWAHTSTAKSGGVTIPVGEDHSVGASGGGSTFIPWDPENPSPKPTPDHFHPDHQAPPEKGRNGPFTGYGPIALHARIAADVEREVALALATGREKTGPDARALSEAMIAAHVELRLIEAERAATFKATGWPEEGAIEG